MPDVVTPEVRSRMMAGIRGRNTRLELALRSGLHKAGFRFRLHVRNLPGKPDIVLPKYRAVIFAQGCFWHGHDCALFRWPATRQDFWKKKIEENRARDKKASAACLSAGWRVLDVWECSVKGTSSIGEREVVLQAVAWLRSLHINSHEIRGLRRKTTK